MAGGAVTAISWSRPSPYQVQTFSAFGDAVAWIEGERGRPGSAVERLLHEARAQAQPDQLG